MTMFRSEATVSEDFDMALTLQGAGYLVRLAAFESPVSASVTFKLPNHG